MKRYLFDDCLEAEAVVTGIHSAGESEFDDRLSLSLSVTIFQDENKRRAADRGTIAGVPIVQVSLSRTGEVLHHVVDGSRPFERGQRVLLRVDEATRQCISQRVCAGRLIELAGAYSILGLTPLDWCHKPHMSFVAFGGHRGCSGSRAFPNPEKVEAEITSFVQKVIPYDLPIAMIGDPRNPGSRRVRFGDFPAIPCDSVYPESLAGLGEIEIRRVLQVGGRLFVHFSVGLPACTVIAPSPTSPLSQAAGDGLPSPYGLFY